MKDATSELAFYSLGVAVANKADGSDSLSIWPTERFSLEHGKLGTNNRNFKSELPDISGIKKKAAIIGGAAITATWLPNGGDNRDTSPDVVAGETVKLYRFADTEKYYWTTIFREPELRRLEHVRYNYSNQPSGQTPSDPDTSYFIEVSTKEQHIRIRTASNNGEPCRYDIKLDTGKGTFTLSDDLGNKLQLDSVAGKLTGITTDSIGLKSKLIHLEGDKIELDGHTVISNLSLTEGLTTPGVVPGSEGIPGYDWS